MNEINAISSEIDALCARDPLAKYAKKFSLPQGCTYLVGHSLGLMSEEAKAYSEEAFKQWRTTAVESWFDPQEGSPIGPWLDIESKISNLLAPFFGATPDDVTVTNALGVNLIFLLHSLYRPEGKKRKIAIMRGMFPQDRWVVSQHLKLPGHSASDVHWIEPRQGERLTRDEDIIELLKKSGNELSVLLLESVSYVTGQAFNMQAIAAEAQAQNVRLIVDVAHGAFVLPLEFNKWGVDAAVGCSYKFGCSGPGGIGLLYVNKRHWSDPTVWRPGGWWGNNRSTQFLMGREWDAAVGAHAWQVSTVPVLAVAPFYGTLQLFSEAGIVAISNKSKQMVKLFADLLQQCNLLGQEFEILTPIESGRFGSEVALEFNDMERAKALKNWLRNEGVLIDYRESPFVQKAGHKSKQGILRAGFHPLFNQYSDILKLALKMKEFLGSFCP